MRNIPLYVVIPLIVMVAVVSGLFLFSSEEPESDSHRVTREIVEVDEREKEDLKTEEPEVDETRGIIEEVILASREKESETPSNSTEKEQELEPQEELVEEDRGDQPESIVVVSAEGNLDVDFFLSLVNAERQKRGLGVLTLNPILTLMAKNYASELLEKDFFGHISPTGETLEVRATQAGYLYAHIGENIAYQTFGDSASFFQMWTESEGHRDNILSREAEETGIAFIKGEFQGEEGIMAVQVFGRRL